MSGIIAAAIVAHVPTLSRAEITPEFQRTLVEGERKLGADLRALKPDLWVIASTHWVSTFNWFATCQAEHKGLCVADEAPDLIPGLPYHYRGDPQFGVALVEEWQRRSIPAARNESPHYEWDYGTFVPLSHLDPHAEIAVVGVPVVLMSDHAECMNAGAAIAATAQRTGAACGVRGQHCSHARAGARSPSDADAGTHRCRPDADRSARARSARRCHCGIHRVQPHRGGGDGRSRARHAARCNARSVTTPVPRSAAGSMANTRSLPAAAMPTC